jgi:hypothetical protein
MSHLIDPGTHLINRNECAKFGIPNESPESECNPGGQADQLHDGVCSIEQRQHGRHHEQEKSRSLGREVLMRFPREVIPANSMERRFAGACVSTISIDACFAGIGARLRGHTPFVPDDENGTGSMTNWEYRFHAKCSDLHESVGSAACFVVPCSTSPSAPPSVYSATLVSAVP